MLINPSSGDLVAVLDWADSRLADPLFDVARLSLQHALLEQPFLDGLQIGNNSDLLRSYRVLWSLMSATWLAEHGYEEGSRSALQNLRTLVRDGRHHVHRT